MPSLPTSAERVLRHLPNVISAARIVLVGPLLWQIVEGGYLAALVLAAVAAASDALDGFLAKRFGWQSWLGSMLDPLADKLLLIGALAALVHIDALPAWLLLVVLLRDGVIVGGALAYHTRVGRFTAQPSMLSKLATAAQIVVVMAELALLAGLLGMHGDVRLALIGLAALLTTVSGIHYLALWTRRMHTNRKTR